MNLKKILPIYPRTPHLPYCPNAQRLDLISTEKECAVLFERNVCIEEKVDGASIGLNFYENHPIIRNRNNFIQKGKTGHLRTSAKMQFASIHNWFYENVDKFEKLNNLTGYCASVYAEWLYAAHSVRYDKLPTYFIAYDIYDWEKGYYINSFKARELLTQCGFTMPELLYSGKIESYESLEPFMQQKSLFSDLDRREGLYIKVSDDEKITHRFKWVRKDFIQGEQWDQRKITKNKLSL